MLAFLPVIYFPIFNQAVPLIHKRITDQVHKKVAMPAFDLKHLDKFPKQFDDFFDDTLAIKDKLILINSLFKIKILDASKINSEVFIGHNGWLFHAGVPMQYYLNKKPYTARRLDSLRTILKRRARWAKERGMKFYFVIVPNKPFIYPEYIPSEYQPSPGLSRTDRIMEFMKRDTDVAIIDLRQVLLKNKGSLPLFYKTDNHWNYLGAYYAYTEIINRIRKDFPSVGIPASLDKFRIDISEVKSGLEAMLLNMEEWYKENQIKLIPKFKAKGKDGKKMNYKLPEGFPFPWDFEIDKETGIDSLPSVVVIRDSFTDFLIPYLKEHFKRSVYIFDAWRYKENRKIIENEKPNIVMLIVLDNGIDALIPNDYLPE